VTDSPLNDRLRQREFFTFGMDVLMKLDLEETRQFFSAFFNLSDFYWQVDPILSNS
jgi:lycopene beta-cyclase